MKTGDWINLATAIGVAVTAAFTAFSFFIFRRQARISQPVLRSHFSGHPFRKHILLTVGIASPESERYEIDRIEVRKPRNAKISLPVYHRDPFGQMVPEEASNWSRLASFYDRREFAGEIFVDAPPGTLLSLRVTISLKSDAKATSSIMHNVKMPA